MITLATIVAIASTLALSTVPFLEGTGSLASK